MSERKSGLSVVMFFLMACSVYGPGLVVNGDDSGGEGDEQGTAVEAVDKPAAAAAEPQTDELSSVHSAADATPPAGPEPGAESAPDLTPRVNAFEADLISGLGRKEEELRKARAEIERLRDIIKRMADANRRELTVMRYNLGCLWRRVGEPRRAEDEFVKALKLTPDDAATHYNLGILYQEDLKDTELARRHYERFLELNPQDRDAAQVRAWLMELSR